MFKTAKRNGFGDLPRYRRRRRRRLLTVARGGLRGCSSPSPWCRALSLSFSLWLPAFPPLFSLFSFSFSLWFSLAFFFPFLFFSFSFLPFLFSLRWLLGQGLKWINFGLIHKPRVGNNARDKSKILILDDICILMHIMSKMSLSGS